MRRLEIDDTPNGYDHVASAMVGTASFLYFASVWFTLQSGSRKRRQARERAAEIHDLEAAVSR